MANLRLYLAPGACSLAPHILLHEAGATFSTVKLSVKDGFPPEYRKINPKSRVPVLQIDDEIITENPAIMTAVSHLSPEKNIMGKSNMDTVRVYEWLNWISGSLHGQGYGGLLRPARYSDDESMYDAIRAKSRDTLAGCYEHVETTIKGPYALGEDFTAVDAYLLVFYRWGNAFKFGMKEKYPKYTRLVQEVGKRESTRAAVEDEGIDTLSD